MHDISLGQCIRDYLTDEEVEATTYEDMRQALAMLLVEEKGYPKSLLRPRVAVSFPVELLMMLFCTGGVTTYVREALAAARLFPEGPTPLVAVTDSRRAVLLETTAGALLREDADAIPDWETLQSLAAERATPRFSEDQLDRERRILFAYSESLYDCCAFAACAAGSRGGRWKA